jgi:hypothetical protein
MPSHATFEVRVGQLADDHVLGARMARFPHHTLISDGFLRMPGADAISLRRGWNSLSGLDRYLAMLRLSLQSDMEAGFLEPISPGYAQKPDLADIDTREVWEVKPKSRYGDSAGAGQVGRYVRLLQTAEREYVSLSRHPRFRSSSRLAPCGMPRTWSCGGAWPIPKMRIVIDKRTVVVTFHFTEPGVIQWALA